MNILNEPLTTDELRRQVDEDGWIEGVVRIELSEAIANDLEGWLDLLSDRLTNSPLLMETSYKVVGHEFDTLFIKVTGDANAILAEAD